METQALVRICRRLIDPLVDFPPYLMGIAHLILASIPGQGGLIHAEGAVREFSNFVNSDPGDDVDLNAAWTRRIVGAFLNSSLLNVGSHERPANQILYKSNRAIATLPLPRRPSTARAAGSESFPSSQVPGSSGRRVCSTEKDGTMTNKELLNRLGAEEELYTYSHDLRPAPKANERSFLSMPYSMPYIQGEDPIKANTETGEVLTERTRKKLASTSLSKSSHPEMVPPEGDWNPETAHTSPRSSPELLGGEYMLEDGPMPQTGLQKPEELLLNPGHVRLVGGKKTRAPEQTPATFGRASLYESTIFDHK